MISPACFSHPGLDSQYRAPGFSLSAIFLRAWSGSEWKQSDRGAEEKAKARSNNEHVSCGGSPDARPRGYLQAHNNNPTVVTAVGSAGGRVCPSRRVRSRCKGAAAAGARRGRRRRHDTNARCGGCCGVSVPSKTHTALVHETSATSAASSLTTAFPPRLRTTVW